MALSEYKWQKTTHKQLTKCISWSQNILQLRDWEVVLDTNDIPPECFLKKVQEIMSKGDTVYGMAKIYEDYLKALIWIPLKHLKEQDANPYSTCFHEMLHVLNRGVLQISGKKDEQYAYRLEIPLYRLYCHEKGLKIAGLRNEV